MTQLTAEERRAYAAGEYDGVVTTPTTQEAVDAAVSDLVAGAPGALDTLNELAAAINDDANFAAATAAALAAKIAASTLTANGNILTRSGGVPAEVTRAALAADAAFTAAYVEKSTLDAQSLLAAVADNTPVPLPVAASRVVGRKASGDLTAMTAAEAIAVLAASGAMPGQDLGYAEITSTFAAASSNAVQDVPGLTIAPTIGDRAAVIEAYCPLFQASAASVWALIIHDVTSDVEVARTGMTVGASGFGALLARRRIPAGTGAKSYKVQVLRYSGSGTANFLGAPTYPMSLAGRVV